MRRLFKPFVALWRWAKANRDEAFSSVLMLSLTVAASWFACDGVRIVANVEDDAVLYKVFLGIIVGIGAIGGVWIFRSCAERSKAKGIIAEISAVAGKTATSTLHSFATPLTDILNILQMFRNGVGEKEEVCKECEGLIRPLIELAELQNEIQLNITKNCAVSPKLFDVAEAIRNQESRYISSARARGVEYSCSFSCETLPVVAHKEKLLMLVDNLVGNAIKYNKPGGSVEVNVAFIEYKRKRYLQIIISDTGIGMNEEEKKNMFKPFYRGARAKAMADGHGEGLELVRSVILFYDGEIACSSIENEGSVFEVRIPLECNG